jgi:hypothetical protein
MNLRPQIMPGSRVNQKLRFLVFRQNFRPSCPEVGFLGSLLLTIDEISPESLTCSSHDRCSSLAPGNRLLKRKGLMAFHEKAGRSQVDSSLASLNKVFCSPAEWPLSPCFHPHSRGAIRFARCILGVLVSAGAAICLAPCGSALEESNLGQAINAVTETRLWALSILFSLPGTVWLLRSCGYCGGVAVVQRFVYFSAYPQVMQQHRQLSRGRHDGSLLPASSATLGQLQAPEPEIAVHTERTQNVLRSLHQKRSQIGIAFFADMQLRLAPA